MDPFAPPPFPQDPHGMSQPSDPGMMGGMGGGPMMGMQEPPMEGVAGGSIDDSIQRGDALAQLLKMMVLERMQKRKEAALAYQQQQVEANSTMFGG